MAFVSVTFLIFLLIVCVVYFLVPKKYQWVWLLIASYTFYLFSGVKMLFFLLLTTVTTFYTGRILGKINSESKSYVAANKETLTREEKKEYKEIQTKKKRKVLALCLVLNLGILVFLKYYNFLSGSINSALSVFSIRDALPAFHLLLPLGISFYTFQAASYIIDVYRGKYEPDTNLGKFALFVSFFPQIIQGPISRYDQLAHQLTEEHSFDYDRVTQGLQLILWGFIKKMVLADRVALLVNHVFSHYQSYSGVTLFLGSACYGIQVYADFSAGMDIARGVAQIMGIEMTLNFERPYFATSVAEFWRRWHITLGAWMRDYVFYSLSLSKAFNHLGKRTKKLLGNDIGKAFPTFLAMFIAFFLVGIWHGSSWKYVAYGIWNGGIISGSILLESTYEKIRTLFRVNTECFSWRFFQIVRTFFLMSIGRVFSRANSFMDSLRYIKRMFSSLDPSVLLNGSLYKLGMTQKNMEIFIGMLFILLIVGILQESGMKIRETLAKQNLYFRWGIYIGAFVLLLVFGIYGPGYSSSEFIYQQF